MHWMKARYILIISVVIVLFLLVFTYWKVQDKIMEYQYDWRHENKEVHTKAEIDLILEGLKKLKFSDLDADYLKYTRSDEAKYKKLIKNLTFYEISIDDLNKRIVGRFRLKNFMCKDNYYKDYVVNKEGALVCIFNPKIFYKTLELMDELEKKGHNKNGFEIVNGHRHPHYNARVGGASMSRHIKGEAVDIVVRDIDNDGKVSKQDKDIILDILETKIIKDEGGIGLYPGTESVHYDVRGVRARWNTY